MCVVCNTCFEVWKCRNAMVMVTNVSRSPKVEVNCPINMSIVSQCRRCQGWIWPELTSLDAQTSVNPAQIVPIHLEHTLQSVEEFAKNRFALLVSWSTWTKLMRWWANWLINHSKPSISVARQLRLLEQNRIKASLLTEQSTDYTIKWMIFFFEMYLRMR